MKVGFLFLLKIGFVALNPFWYSKQQNWLWKQQIQFSSLPISFQCYPSGNWLTLKLLRFDEQCYKHKQTSSLRGHWIWVHTTFSAPCRWQSSSWECCLTFLNKWPASCPPTLFTLHYRLDGLVEIDGIYESSLNWFVHRVNTHRIINRWGWHVIFHVNY